MLSGTRAFRHSNRPVFSSRATVANCFDSPRYVVKKILPPLKIGVECPESLWTRQHSASGASRSVGSGSDERDTPASERKYSVPLGTKSTAPARYVVAAIAMSKTVCRRNDIVIGNLRAVLTTITCAAQSQLRQLKVAAD